MISNNSLKEFFTVRVAIQDLSMMNRNMLASILLEKLLLVRVVVGAILVPLSHSGVAQSQDGWSSLRRHTDVLLCST